MTITKKEAITSIFYSVFLISRFTQKQFINYGMKNWNIKDNISLLDYSRLLLEAQEREQEIRKEIEEYYHK